MSALDPKRHAQAPNHVSICHDPSLSRRGCGLRSIHYTERPKDGGDVRFGRLFGEVEHAAYLLVGQSAAQLSQYLRLPLGHTSNGGT